MDRKLSAKDLAFEKERVKFRQKINELEIKIKAQEQSINLAMAKAHKAESELAIYKDWVERLLDYCNMTPQELETLLANEKRKNELAERLDGFLKILDRRFY